MILKTGAGGERKAHFFARNTLPTGNYGLYALVKLETPHSALELTNANKADLSFCLADFLNAKIIFGDTTVSGAFITPVLQGL